MDTLAFLNCELPDYAWKILNEAKAKSVYVQKIAVSRNLSKDLAFKQVISRMPLTYEGNFKHIFLDFYDIELTFEMLTLFSRF